MVSIAKASGGAGQTPSTVSMGSQAKRGGKSAGMSLGSLWVCEVEDSSRSRRRMRDWRSGCREKEGKSKGAKTSEMINCERNKGDFVFIERMDKGGGSRGRRRATLEFGATARQVSPRD
jgi:hypothetical protein